MNIKKIAIVILVILILGAGGILYLRNYYQNKDKVVSNWDNFIKEGKLISEDWTNSMMEKKVKNGSQSGSVTYNFKSTLISGDKVVRKTEGVANFRGAYFDTKIVFRGSEYLTDKEIEIENEIRENKGVVYYKNNQKDGKFLKIPLTDNGGKALSNAFFDYDFNSLLIEVSRNIEAVKDLGNDTINNEKVKIVKYGSILNASNEEKYIKLWISENNAVVLKAEIETRELPSDVSVNGSISKNLIEITGYNFEKIPTTTFIPPINEINDQTAIQRNPNIFTDSDNDGIIDSAEVNLYKTNPNNSDTDSDGFKDGDEMDSGYNPLEAGQEGKLFNY